MIGWRIDDTGQVGGYIFLCQMRMDGKIKMSLSNTRLHSGRVHLGMGEKTVPKSLEGCSMDMFPQMAKE